MTLNPLIHIGYHKTGTSYLQSRFFVESYGFRRWPSNQRAIHPALIDLGPYDVVTKSVRDTLNREIDEAATLEQTFVLSHERLSGHPSSGGFDAKSIADRLHSLFPNAKVLMIFREQESMIRSAYSQFVTEGGSLSLRRYLTPPQPDVRKCPYFAFEHFEYAPAIKYYQQLFGNHNVLALPYEHFANSPIEFLNAVGQFGKGDTWNELTIDSYEASKVNVAKKVLTQTIRRSLNAVLVRTQFSNSGWLNLPKLIRLYEKTCPKLEPLIPKSIDRWAVARQKAAIRRVVGNHFAPYNCATSELTGFDLREFGYRVD